MASVQWLPAYFNGRHFTWVDEYMHSVGQQTCISDHRSLQVHVDTSIAADMMASIVALINGQQQLLDHYKSLQVCIFHFCFDTLCFDSSRAILGPDTEISEWFEADTQDMLHGSGVHKLKCV